MTVKQFFSEVVSDLRVPENTKIYQDRFDITNRSVEAVVHHFYHLMAGYYHTSASVSVLTGEIDLSAISTMPGIFEKGTTIVDGNETYSPTSLARYHILKDTLFADKNYRVFTKVGDKLLINASDGAVTMFYYKKPTEVSQDSDVLDVPDGAAIDLAITKAKVIAQERLGQDPQINRGEVKDQIGRLSEQYNHSISQEQLEDKIQAFI